MEMIAMLGGLGASPGFSPEGAAFASQISAAPTIEALAAIVVAIDSAKGSLRPDEVSALKVIAMQKKDDLLTPPFYKRPGYWLVVAGLAAAWWHREKIKSWFAGRGLNGLGQSDYYRMIEEMGRRGMLEDPAGRADRQRIMRAQEEAAFRAKAGPVRRLTDIEIREQYGSRDRGSLRGLSASPVGAGGRRAVRRGGAREWLQKPETATGQQRISAPPEYLTLLAEAERNLREVEARRRDLDVDRPERYFYTANKYYDKAQQLLDEARREAPPFQRELMKPVEDRINRLKDTMEWARQRAEAQDLRMKRMYEADDMPMTTGKWLQVASKMERSGR